jgi:hypothetical protein
MNHVMGFSPGPFYLFPYFTNPFHPVLMGRGDITGKFFHLNSNPHLNPPFINEFVIAANGGGFLDAAA